MKERKTRTSGRRYVVTASVIGAALSIVALIYAYAQYSDTYVERLIAWGMFCLFTFHGLFALVKNLNPRLVRAIDYVYLATAAFGVVVFALNYAEKRDEFERREHHARAEVEIEQARTEVRKQLDALEQISCEQATQQALPTYCEAAKTIRRELDVASPREAREAVIDRYASEVTQPTQLLDAYMVQAYKRLENQVLNFKLATMQLTLADFHSEFNEPLPPDDPGKVYFLYSWPFILAIAFALRITRTTIEVFDWTTPAPEPPMVLTKPPGETYPDLSSPAPPWLVVERSSAGDAQSKPEENRSPVTPSRSS